MKVILEDPDYNWKLAASATAGKAAARAVDDFDKNSPLVPDTNIATLRWSDLQVGELLGTGAFSQVYEVQVLRNQHKLATIATTDEASVSKHGSPHCGRYDNYDGTPARPRRCWDSFMNLRQPVDHELFCYGHGSTYSDRLLHDSRHHEGHTASCVWDMESIADVALMEDMVEVNSSFESAPFFESPPSFVIKHLDISKIQNQSAYIANAIDIVMEARLLSCLQHENIVKLFALMEGPIESAFSSHSRGYFLILSRLHGTLEDRINEWSSNRMVMTDRLPIALGIAKGMRFLHQHSIVYRDLKPQNLGLSQDGTVKIYDFGLSTELPRPGQKPLTTRTGSQRYMAPEVVLKRAYGLEVDVFSFAIVVWEMFSLNKPFHGMKSSEHALRVAKGHERPDLMLVPSSQIQQILSIAWEAIPSNRPTFEQIVEMLEPTHESPLHEASPKSSSIPNIVMRFVKNGMQRGKVSSKIDKSLKKPKCKGDNQR